MAEEEKETIPTPAPRPTIQKICDYLPKWVPGVSQACGERERMEEGTSVFGGTTEEPKK
jgi:hypothetical protein